ncbi:MAG: hypothetical protein KDE22_14770 [Rhodobacterales bacterium]|nr:hypothetical protein [Rhodobacterales bacterium]
MPVLDLTARDYTFPHDFERDGWDRDMIAPRALGHRAATGATIEQRTPLGV